MIKIKWAIILISFSICADTHAVAPINDKKFYTCKKNSDCTTVIYNCTYLSVNEEHVEEYLDLALKERPNCPSLNEDTELPKENICVKGLCQLKLRPAK